MSQPSNSENGKQPKKWQKYALGALVIVGIIIAIILSSGNKKTCLQNCSGSNGVCNTSTGICACNNGFTGNDCNVVMLKTCPQNCSGNGVCNTSTGICACNNGFGGNNCSLQVKKCPENCSGNGVCNTSTGICYCNKGFGGNDCKEKKCPENCAVNGVCNTSTGICACNNDFGGNDCSKPIYKLTFSAVNDRTGYLIPNGKNIDPVYNHENIYGTWHLEKFTIITKFDSPEVTIQYILVDCNDFVRRKEPNEAYKDPTQITFHINHDDYADKSKEGATPSGTTAVQRHQNTVKVSLAQGSLDKTKPTPPIKGGQYKFIKNVNGGDYTLSTENPTISSNLDTIKSGEYVSVYYAGGTALEGKTNMTVTIVCM